MKLYSSTFISVVMAFLMLIGYNGQTVEKVEDPTLPTFSNIHELNVENNDNTIKVEVFDSLFCDNCTDFINNTLPKIRNLDQETENIDLRLYFIPDINDEINYMAASSLKCAADQDKFWAMHEIIHKNKAELTKKSFQTFGEELQLMTDALAECIKEDVHKKAIEEDIKYAAEKDIKHHPTTLIGKYLLIGNQPYENIQKIINKSIKRIEKNTVTSPVNSDVEVLKVKDLTDAPDIQIGNDVINSEPTKTTPTPDINLDM